MDSARLIFIFIILQNILDCDGLSLTDQLIRLLQYRRDIDYPEDYQIWVESRSAEEKSEEALSREEETEDEPSEYVAAVSEHNNLILICLVVLTVASAAAEHEVSGSIAGSDGNRSTQEEDALDEPAEYVAVDKPVARVIRDYYKLEQEKKKKKMQMERALLEPQEMHPYVEIMPPPPPPPPERQYEQVRQELYQPPRPVQPPPVRPSTFIQQRPALSQRLQQNPVKIKPRYVKPKAKFVQTKRRQPQKIDMVQIEEKPDQAPFAPPTFDDIVDMKFEVEDDVNLQKDARPFVMRTNDDTDLRLLRSELQNMTKMQTKDIEKMQLEISELRKTNELFNKKVKDLEERLESANQEKKHTPRSSALGQLEDTVMKLEQQIHERELELFSTDLEILNIPEKRGEDLTSIVQDLARSLGVLVETRDVVFTERVGSSLDGVGSMPEATRQGPKPSPIIARLSRSPLRDEIVRRARLNRNATRGAVVKERLADSDKELFRLARHIANSRGWKYIWIKQGRILAKQSAKHPTYYIRNEADIERIFSKAVTPAINRPDSKPFASDTGSNNTNVTSRQVKPFGNTGIVTQTEEFPTNSRPTYEIRFDPKHKTHIEKADIFPDAK
ncbi:genetic suppressor element 1 [Helicoverpa armigera]|uniref:genetic suppressor element 1 n=1 Tax=Helicoverpa armigera TaxID=29058 RepID=UPI0030834D37